MQLVYFLYTHIYTCMYTQCISIYTHMKVPFYLPENEWRCQRFANNSTWTEAEREMRRKRSWLSQRGRGSGEDEVEETNGEYEGNEGNGNRFQILVL